MALTLRSGVQVTNGHFPWDGRNAENHCCDGIRAGMEDRPLLDPSSAKYHLGADSHVFDLPDVNLDIGQESLLPSSVK